MKKKEESKIEKENSLAAKVFVIVLIMYFILIIAIMDGSEIGLPILIIINFVLVISCVGSLIYINKKYKDKFSEVKEYEYYRNLDIKNITAVASGVLTKKVKVDINTVITAIYELAEKNIIEIKYKDKKNLLSLKEHDKNKINSLLKYEKSIIKFIFDDPEDIKTYCLEDMLKELEENSTKRYIIQEIEKEIEEHINKKYCYSIENYIMNQENLLFVKLSTVMPIIILIFSALPILSSLLLFQFSNWVVDILYIEYIVNLISVIYYCKVKFIKSQYHDEIQKIHGLYAYMSDYSLLKSQEIKFYQLYDKYYLYAMGLGLADKFEKEFNQPTLDNNVRTALRFYMQNKGEM